MRSLLVVVILLVPAFASADAIRSPNECPEAGWVAVRHGHGMWCTPRACTTDAECPGSGTCQQIDRCWRQSTYGMGRRRWNEEDGPRPTAARAGERCGAQRSCSGDATCQSAQECVYPEGTSLSAVRDGEVPQSVVPEPESEPAEPETEAEQPQPQPQPQARPATDETDEGCSAGAGQNRNGHGSLAGLFAILFLLRRRE